jgi:hypothetical protein
MKTFGNLILMTLLCVAIFIVFMGIRPAPAKDLFVAVLQDKQGKASMHYQAIPDGTCTSALAKFREHAKRGKRHQEPVSPHVKEQAELIGLPAVAGGAVGARVLVTSPGPYKSAIRKNIKPPSCFR